MTTNINQEIFFRKEPIPFINRL